MVTKEHSHIIRPATLDDVSKLIDLYKTVASISGGIARVANEISESFVTNFITKSLRNGISLVAENPNNSGQLIAEIHAYKADPQVFNHLLTDVAIVVHPDFQGVGLGFTIFKTFLDEVTNNRPDIVRVELMARESNTKAIALYKKLGFVIEGTFAQRIRSDKGDYEADLGMAWFNPKYLPKNDTI